MPFLVPIAIGVGEGVADAAASAGVAAAADAGASAAADVGATAATDVGASASMDAAADVGADATTDVGEDVGGKLAQTGEKIGKDVSDLGKNFLKGMEKGHKLYDDLNNNNNNGNSNNSSPEEALAKLLSEIQSAGVVLTKAIGAAQEAQADRHSTPARLENPMGETSPGHIEGPQGSEELARPEAENHVAPMDYHESIPRSGNMRI